jgi:hypothetical protein
MRGGFGKDILNDSPRQFACTLILFQDNQDCHTGFDVGTGLPIHEFTPGGQKATPFQSGSLLSTILVPQLC